MQFPTESGESALHTRRDKPHLDVCISDQAHPDACIQQATLPNRIHDGPESSPSEDGDTTIYILSLVKLVQITMEKNWLDFVTIRFERCQQLWKFSPA